MYKSTVKNQQHAATSSANVFKIASGLPDLTVTERYETAKEAYKRLIAINQNETDKFKNAINGLKLHDMTKKLSKLREEVNKNKPPNQVADYIIQIFKERTTKDEWVNIVKEAKKRAME